MSNRILLETSNSPNNIRQQQRLDGQQLIQSHSSIYSSDGFSCSSDSLPAPLIYQRNTSNIEQNSLNKQLNGDNNNKIQTNLAWDTFRLLPPEPDRNSKESTENRVIITPKNAAKWAWALLLSLFIPE
uniref:Uncharacterized protein n=1 Tax=Meloidogyne hapla TaxID=6305 RepID=A0A1I8BC04_MELHA